MLDGETVRLPMTPNLRSRQGQVDAGDRVGSKLILQLGGYSIDSFAHQLCVIPDWNTSLFGLFPPPADDEPLLQGSSPLNVSIPITFHGVAEEVLVLEGRASAGTKFPFTAFINLTAPEFLQSYDKQSTRIQLGGLDTHGVFRSRAAGNHLHLSVAKLTEQEERRAYAPTVCKRSWREFVVATTEAEVKVSRTGNKRTQADALLLVFSRNRNIIRIIL